MSDFRRYVFDSMAEADAFAEELGKACPTGDTDISVHPAAEALGALDGKWQVNTDASPDACYVVMQVLTDKKEAMGWYLRVTPDAR